MISPIDKRDVYVIMGQPSLQILEVLYRLFPVKNYVILNVSPL